MGLNPPVPQEAWSSRGGHSCSEACGVRVGTPYMDPLLPETSSRRGCNAKRVVQDFELWTREAWIRVKAPSSLCSQVSEEADHAAMLLLR